MSQVTDSYRARTGQGVKAYFTEDSEYASANWFLIPGATSMSGPNFTKAEIDVTNLASTGKEYLTGLPDPGSIEFAANLDELNTMHRKFLTETLYADQYYWLKVEWPTGFTMIFNVQLMSAPISLGVDAAQTVTFTFRISGKPISMDKGNAASISWDSTLIGEFDDGSVAGNVVGTLTALEVADASYLTTITDGATFTQGTHFTVTGVPSGLTAVLTKTSDTVATLTFTGAAISKVDVSNIVLNLTDTAFTNATAGNVSGSAKSGIAITFA